MKIKGCYKCPIRTEGCHGRCPWYKEYRRKIDLAREEKERRNMYSIIPERDKKLPQL